MKRDLHISANYLLITERLGRWAMAKKEQKPEKKDNKKKK